jgi:ribosome biogenesis GTPase / thiamine phosphate phosphatase
MNKRKLSLKQKERIKRNQDAFINPECSSQGPIHEGLVISRHANVAEVEDESHNLVRCKLRQNLGSVVAGDHVKWCMDNNQQAVILSRLERHSVLGRPDKRGNIRPVAANVDKVLIVIAPKPAPSSLLIDSYLVAAETLKIPPVIIFNKSDLSPTFKLLDTYRNIGYPIVETSCIDHEPLNNEALVQCLKNQVCVFVGQSGVGKSTLIKNLVPNSNPKTSSISTAAKLGKHTTSNSTLYHLPFAGDIIDSPGIREFGLWHMDKEKITNGFIEVRPFIGKCKYKNCAHRNEPGCALKIAVAKGKLSPTRLSSLQGLTSH